MLQIFTSFPILMFSQGTAATRLRCGGVVNDDFVAYLLVNMSVKNVENRPTFGKVMDNIIMAFLTHSVVL